MELTDRHVVITGGASGIGRAVALACARQDARGVIVSDVDLLGAEAVAQEIEHDLAGAAAAVACDVADREEMAELLAAAEERFGPVDVFFANAGISGGTGLEETSDEEWDEAFEVNVRAHVVAARLLIPGWVERGEGYFVSTASAAGLLTVLGSAPYAVTKHAAVAFAEWLSITYGDRGVRVSCLCPMAVQTKLLQEGLKLSGEAGAGMRVVMHAGRLLEPEEVADAVVAGVAEERFLILPHPEVQAMFASKASDHDAWIGSMRHVRASVLEASAASADGRAS